MLAPPARCCLRSALRGHSSAGRAPALQAGGRRFDPVWLHQRDCNPTARFVRKYLFSRVADATCGFSDIVKRRSLRAAGGMKISCAAQSPASRRAGGRKVVRRVAMLVVTCLTAGGVGPISKQAGLSNQCPIMAALTVTIATPSGNGH
jgi:hypothetical protein